MSHHNAKPDFLWDLAVQFYEQEESAARAAARIDEETGHTASETWVRKVCHERGVSLRNGFPDALKEEAQRLVDEGLTNQAVAERLQKRVDRDGPSASWVSRYTERDEDFHTYERRGRRTFTYNGTEIEVRGPTPVETCTELLRRYDEGVPPSVLLEEHDVNRGFLLNLCERAGIRRNYSEARINRLIWEGEDSPIARRREVERLYTEEELSTTQIAERVGKDEETIRNDLEARGVERRPRALGLILRHWGSLEEYQSFTRRVYIETKHKGRTVAEVAEEESVHEDTVSRACDWWKHFLKQAGSVTELYQKQRERASTP